MRIAILGTRGIPARYGGFETFAEELSTRLADRGHIVSVYCREKHEVSAFRGVSLRYLPSVRHKYLDTLAHTFFFHFPLPFSPRRFFLVLQRTQPNINPFPEIFRDSGSFEVRRLRA